MKNPPFTEQTILRFFEGSLNDSQHQQILDWLILQDSDVLEAFMDKQLEFVELSEFKGGISTSEFSVVENRINARRKMRLQILRWGTGIAASLLPLVFLYMSVGNNFHTEQQVERIATARKSSNIFVRQNNFVRPENFYLPDSSLVTLYQGSRVTYTSNRLNTSRQVHLSGKAFFDVRHMEKRPFTVFTGSVRTVVLGTSFLVNADSGYNRILVKVKSGKVGVIYSTKPAVFLLPKETAIFRSGTGLVKLPMAEKPAKEKMTLLPQSLLAFNQTPLNTVLEELSTAFDRQITFSENQDPLGQMPVSLSTKGKTLNEILNEIKTQIPLEYEITKDRIIISQK